MFVFLFILFTLYFCTGLIKNIIFLIEYFLSVYKKEDTKTILKE